MTWNSRENDALKVKRPWWWCWERRLLGLIYVTGRKKIQNPGKMRSEGQENSRPFHSLWFFSFRRKSSLNIWNLFWPKGKKNWYLELFDPYSWGYISLMSVSVVLSPNKARLWKSQSVPPACPLSNLDCNRWSHRTRLQRFASRVMGIRGWSLENSKRKCHLRRQEDEEKRSMVVREIRR